MRATELSLSEQIRGPIGRWLDRRAERPLRRAVEEKNEWNNAHYRRDLQAARAAATHYR
jgi:hypothetical protein